MKNGVQAQNIPFVTLYERTRDGQTYLVGRLGNARILVVPTAQKSRGDRVWEGVLAMGRIRQRELLRSLVRRRPKLRSDDESGHDVSRSLQHLHVLDFTETSIRTATEESTAWFLWLPRDERVTWIDAPVCGALARAHVPD
jgi:hypothetical protein